MTNIREAEEHLAERLRTASLSVDPDTDAAWERLATSLNLDSPPADVRLAWDRSDNRRQRRRASAILVAAALAAMGAVGVGAMLRGDEESVMTSNDARSSPQDSTNVRAPQSTVTSAHAPPSEGSGGIGPYDAWGLRRWLADEEADAFGGLYEDDGILVVQVLPGREAPVREAKEEFDRRNRFDRPPPYRIAFVSNSLARLETLHARLIAAHDSLVAQGVSIVASGVDDRANALTVGLSEDSRAQRATVLEVLDAEADEVAFEVGSVVPPT